MANEILVDYPTPSLANAVYATLSTGNVQTWNPALGTPAFEPDAAAHWAQYALMCSDASGMGRYLATVPAAVPTGIMVTMRGYLAATPGTAARGDARIAGPADLFWDGTNLTTPATAYADGAPLNHMGDGTVPQSSYTGTTLIQPSGSLKFGTATTGQMLMVLNAATNAGAYAMITGNSSGTLQFSAGWVGGQPTGKLTYKIVPAPAPTGGSSSGPAPGLGFAGGQVTAASLTQISFQGTGLLPAGDYNGRRLYVPNQECPHFSYLTINGCQSHTVDVSGTIHTFTFPSPERQLLSTADIVAVVGF